MCTASSSGYNILVHYVLIMDAFIYVIVIKLVILDTLHMNNMMTVQTFLFTFQFDSNN
jgi:hypothetical protein